MVAGFAIVPPVRRHPVLMRLLALIGALAVIAGLAVAFFVFRGGFDVAATHDDPPWLANMLIRVRTASIARRATARPPISLDDAAIIRDGARAFAGAGCASCHGGPGVDWAKFAEGLNPGPPDLGDIAKVLPATEIFWVIKNGIRMTGMPSFEKAGLADDQISRIAAFVKHIPDVKPEDYKTWTTAP